MSYNNKKGHYTQTATLYNTLLFLDDIHESNIHVIITCSNISKRTEFLINNLVQLHVRHTLRHIAAVHHYIRHQFIINNSSGRAQCDFCVTKFAWEIDLNGDQVNEECILKCELPQG